MAEKFNSFGDLGKAQGITPSAPPPNRPGGPPQGPAPTAGNTLEADFFEPGFDYVKKAENVMASLQAIDKWSKKMTFGNFTTSKIRNILSLTSELGNRIMQVKEPELSEELADKIRYIKVRLAYEAGREQDVKKFLEKSSLLDITGMIGRDKKRYARFEKYLEALVAFHRYLGGKD